MTTIRSPLRLSLLFVACFVGAWLGTSSVAAQRSGATHGTVVMPFDGPGSDEVRQQVYDALREDRRLDVAQLDEGSPNAQLLISGSTSGRPSRRGFELFATDAQGNELGSQSGRVGRGAAGRRAVADATRALVDGAVGRLPAPRPAATEETPTTSTTPEAVSDEPAHDAPTTSPGATNANDDPPILALLAGAVFRTRTSEVQLRNGGRQLYDVGMYVELAAALELRPFAHDPGLLRGLFVRGSYAHAVGLGTQDCANGTCQRYDTTFFRAYGDVGFLFDLGRIAEIGAAVGFGFEAYQIADNRVMPGVEYPYLRPSVRGRIRIVQEMLVLDADVGFRSLFGRDRLGTAFGPNGDSFGLDASLGVTGIFDFGLMYRADFTWAGYWHSFQGGGSVQDGESGTDQGFRIGVMLGYGFR